MWTILIWSIRIHCLFIDQHSIFTTCRGVFCRHCQSAINSTKAWPPGKQILVFEIFMPILNIPFIQFLQYIYVAEKSSVWLLIIKYLSRWFFHFKVTQWSFYFFSTKLFIFLSIFFHIHFKVAIKIQSYKKFTKM